MPPNSGLRLMDFMLFPSADVVAPQWTLHLNLVLSSEHPTL